MLTALDQIIADNGGFFRRADALAVGYTDRDLQQARRAELIIRLRHGSYAPAEAYARASPRERHLILAGAVVSAQRQPVALTGPSAALLHGHAIWGHDLERVHLIRLDGASGRREAGVVHHRMTTDIVDALARVPPPRGVRRQGEVRRPPEAERRDRPTWCSARSNARMPCGRSGTA